MKKVLIAVIALVLSAMLTTCSQNQERNLQITETVPTSEPYIEKAIVNGKTYECDYSQERDKLGEQAEQLKMRFEGVLNEYSFVSGHWLCLYDSHGTKIRSVRIGSDPFGFFPELPAMLFDNRGNLISLTSYDIAEGYFVYCFCYDDQNRIIYSQERSYTVAYKEGEAAGDPYDIDLHWEYAEDGSYIVKMSSCVERSNGTGYVDESIIWYDANGNELEYKVFDSTTGEYVDWSVFWEPDK